MVLGQSSNLCSLTSVVLKPSLKDKVFQKYVQITLTANYCAKRAINHFRKVFRLGVGQNNRAGFSMSLELFEQLTVSHDYSVCLKTQVN